MRFLAIAIVYLARERGWLPRVVIVALSFFFLGEFLVLVNYGTDKAYSYFLCPIANSFHIWAIPLLGYVYFREQSIEKQKTEDELRAYRDRLEDLVGERTAELTDANEHLQVEIAERVQAERALAQLSRQNELILNSAGEGIFGVDVEGRHTFVNPTAARMLGYEVADLIGKSSHATWHHSRADGSSYPEGECPLHNGIRSGLPSGGDDELFWRKDGTHFPVRYMSTPLYEEGELVGAVVVFQDITERKRFEQEITQRNAELAAQNAIVATISQSLDLDTVLHAALDRALAVLGMESGCVFLLEPDDKTLELQVSRGGASADDPDAFEREQCLCEEISYRAVSTSHPVVRKVAESGAASPCGLGASDLQLMVSTPLISKGFAVGALTLGTRRESAVLPQELDLLTAIGQQIGMAVENAHLYRETERWAEGLALLHKLSVFLSSTLDPNTIYQQIVEQSARLVGCSSTVLFNWDEQREQGVGISSFGPSGPTLEGTRLTAELCPLLPEMISQRQSIVIDDALSDPRLPSMWRAFGIGALLCVSLRGTGGPVGFLFLIDQPGPRRWRADEVELVESFVNRAAIALENAQLHQQLEWAAALEERQRIAADMHDGLAQTLSVLGFKTDRAADLLDDGQVQQVLDEFQEIRDTIGRATTEVRQSIASLQDSPQPRQPLQDSISAIIDELNAEAEPPIEWVNQVRDALYLPHESTEQVLRVVQEGLVNARRHAAARHITVSLAANGNEFAVSVQDDGRGFDPERPPNQDADHFGLGVMRARAARIGGRVTVDSALGQGTRVQLSWPRSGQSAAANRESVPGDAD